MAKRLLACVAPLIASAVLTPGTAAATAPRWRDCPDAATNARCGRVTVPLDRSGATAGKMQIAFELYERRDRDAPSLGTIVAVEGGPGFATTGSRESYLTLHRPLLARRNLLLVDARGTGGSGALDCPAFRRSLAEYARRAGVCARQLGPRVDLYGTHAVADDLAAVLDALRIRAVDLYGDSYGSYVAQAFAVRHEERVRSLVLDGTYPLPGTDPAFGDLAEATRRGLRLACERRPSCAARGEDPVAVVQRLLAAVRRRPLTGTAFDADGARTRVRVDEPAVAGMLQSAYASIAIYRDVSAAVRAFEAGDGAPLERLVAETTVDPGDTSAANGFSEALYLAVTCHDYPQMWDPAAAPALRQAQLAHTRDTLSAEHFAPFSPTVWTSLDYEGAAACLHWPGPRHADPPVPADALYPAVPTLVLNGDLDNITASSGAQVVAARFPRSSFVETHNTVHISALGDRDRCASRLVRRFVRTLRAGDTSCASRIAEVRVVDRFPRTAAQAEPATARRGNRSSVAARRVAAVAAATVADAIQRWAINASGAARGLRGGRWSYSGERTVRFRFDGARFARDVPVNGTATWRLATGAVRARVAVGGRGRVRARWSMQRRLARAVLTGEVDGRRLRATMLAP